MATERQREELAVLMDWLHEHRDQLAYPAGDIRTESVAAINSAGALMARVNRKGGAAWDCSQTVIALLLAVGCKVKHPDGYTGTLLADLPNYSDARACYIGALAVYGPGTGHHVTMTRHRDTHHGNPVQFSQGSSSDPRYINLLTEAAYQPHGIRLLSIAKL